MPIRAASAVLRITMPHSSDKPRMAWIPSDSASLLTNCALGQVMIVTLLLRKLTEPSESANPRRNHSLDSAGAVNSQSIFTGFLLVVSPFLNPRQHSYIHITVGDHFESHLNWGFGLPFLTGLSLILLQGIPKSRKQRATNPPNARFSWCFVVNSRLTLIFIRLVTGWCLVRSPTSQPKT